MESTELIQKMIEKAESVQAEVTKIEAFEEAVRYVVELTSKQGGHSVAAPCLASLDRDILERACKEAGLILHTEELRSAADAIYISLTYADWGLADTGTLVLDSRSEDLRIATMMSEIHVAVLPSDKIKPDSAAITGILNENLKSIDPSYLAFITGASRTADIERVLAIGVHGPRELHILIMGGHNND